MPFDAARAMLQGPDSFLRFRVPASAVSLGSAGLDPNELVAIVERAGQRRALLVRQLAYHHVAEGSLGGDPFVASF